MTFAEIVLSVFSNIFSSETTGLIVAIFYMEHPIVRDGIFLDGLCHMNKIAAVLIYGKNPLKIFFSRTFR